MADEDPTSGMLWIVIVGGITMFATSCGIGANDVANSFATSVGAKTLTLRQAVIIASIFEFSGAFFLGSRVTDTIRKGMLDNDAFEPDVLMFGMLCASFSTAVWLAVATYFKAPVSTTHSTVAAVVGFGAVVAIKEGNSDIIKWGEIYKIMVSWFIAPIMGGILGFLIFSINKYGAFERKNPVKKAFRIFPIMFGITIGANIFFIIYKGTPQLELDDTDLGVALGITFGVAAVTSLLSYVIVHFILYDKLMKYLTKDDNNIENIMIIKDNHIGESIVDDYVYETLNRTIINKNKNKNRRIIITDIDAAIRGDGNATETEETEEEEDYYIEEIEIIPRLTIEENSNNRNSNDIIIAAYVNETTSDNQERNIECNDSNTELGLTTEQEFKLANAKYGNMETFKNMKMYDNSIEKLYTSLQVFTAFFSSFAHGSNDVANSIAPFTAIYTIYQDNGYQKKSEVPLWILAMGGVGIVIGLSLWGKKIIDRIGNELAGITPTRGFAMELSSSITVVLASRLKIPVSTTQVQTGSIIGTSLSDGRKNVSFKTFAKIFFGWVITLPIAAGLSAALFSFGYYSPSNNETV